MFGVSLTESVGGGARLAQDVITAALAAVDTLAAVRARDDRAWSRRFPRDFRNMLQLCLADATAVPQVAAAGLAALHAQLQFSRSDGSGPLDAALRETVVEPGLRSREAHGRGATAPAEFRIPYQGKLLAGDDIRRQADRWVKRGIIEPGCGAALHRLVRQPHWFDLSDRCLAWIGPLGSESALQWLLQWRPNIALVTPPAARNATLLAKWIHSGNARVFLPERCGQASAGGDVDLFHDTPALARWLQQLGRPLDFGSCTEPDRQQPLIHNGTIDALLAACLELEPRHSLCYLANARDLYAVPEDAVRGANARLKKQSPRARLMQESLCRLSAGRLFQRQFPEHGQGSGIVDALQPAAGADVALARRLPQWRALLARWQGIQAGLHVIADALTDRFGDSQRFDLEAFRPDTRAALFAALWVHDLRHSRAPANPALRLQTPLELFMVEAAHGGLWRMPWLPRSVLPLLPLLRALRLDRGLGPT